MKNIPPLCHGSRNEPEIVTLLGSMKEAMKQALNECQEHVSHLTINLDGKQIYKKDGW